MSFWENNKGSIKSGGMSLLKGAGKATATVSKAGYGAYKNHQANKKNALAESEEVEQQTAPIPAASYRDPHSFPPPPHHGAEGRPPTMYNQQSSFSSLYGQQPPAPAPYGQQPPTSTVYGQQSPAPAPYGQQPPASSPYGQQPPAPAPYGQQPPTSTVYGQQPPTSTVYGQQSPAPAPYGQQPPASAPYGQQPPASNPTPYGQQPPASTTYGQQPPAPTPYGQQPPVSNPTPYVQQPPASTTYGQQPPAPAPYGQRPQASNPIPYGQQLPASTTYGQQPPDPYTQQTAAPISTPYGESTLGSEYGQQPSIPIQYSVRSSTTSLYIENDPSVSAPYNQASQSAHEVQHPLPKFDEPPYNHTPTEQLSFNNPYHQIDATTQQTPQLIEHRYDESTAHLPPPPKRVLPPKQCSFAITEVPPPQYSLEPQQQYEPITMPSSATISQQVPGVTSPTMSTTYSEVPPRQQYGPPILPQRVPTDMSEKLADDEASQKGLRPGQEVIQEPKFKNNLMDFDISKFGAPPPRARLTKDEESRLSRERAEKQRLKAIKENSLLKARETNSRQLSPYASSNPSSSKVYLATETLVSTPDPDSVPKSFELPDISKFQPPPTISAVKRLDSITGGTSVLEGAQPLQNSVHGELPLGPGRFELPNVAKYQPPRAVPQHQDISSSDISSVKSFHTAPGTPPLESYTESDKITSDHFASAEEKLSHTLRGEDLFNRAPCPLPDKKTAPPKPLKNQHASDTALELERQHFTPPLFHSSDSKPHLEYSNTHLRTVPPPKPAKLSGDSLSELAMSKKKKAPPPKPVKKPSVDSVVRGNHIRELQAKLGKLDFQ